MIASVKLWGVRVLAYLTNSVVRHIPSFTLRRAWYRRLGLRIGAGSGIHRGCFMWFFSPGHLAGTGSSIGANPRILRDCCLDLRAPITIGDNVSISPEVSIITTQPAGASPASSSRAALS